MRVILVAAGRAAAPLRVNLVCFHLHRQVCMLAPAMALSPALPALPTFARSTVPHGAVWAAWCADHGHQAMPADPLAVAAYLAERPERGRRRSYGA